ncbi:hypothetical protein RFI_20372, partial [Reticulomyxa filosa]
MKFKALNTNKICIIPALVNKETNSVARSDSDKAYLLAMTFAEPQPSKDVDEKHYEMVEDKIKFKVAIYKLLELDDNYVCSFDIYQSDITREENGSNAMIDSLLFLFGRSFRMGYIPIAWKKANIMHIHKPDRDHNQCKNHRPIALLSNVGKLMERIITRRLMCWLNEKQLLNQTQAGFQSWHTDELLLRLTETIHKSFDCNPVSYVVLLDISVAYDSVWRNGLRYKMRNEFKLDRRLYWWIESFLLDRLGRV